MSKTKPTFPYAPPAPRPCPESFSFYEILSLNQFGVDFYTCSG